LNAAAGYNCKRVEFWEGESGDSFSGNVSERASVIQPTNFDSLTTLNNGAIHSNYMGRQNTTSLYPWWQFPQAKLEFNKHKREIIQNA
jgi:hypothetical protein